MKNQNLLDLWKAEESIAHIHGWDFSHIDGRYEEEMDFPWDYKTEILKYLQPEWQILDLDTGGGEFLLSLGHPCDKMAATEGYEPNVELCRKELLPMGIDFRPANAGGEFPFEDNRFDLVINRHGDLNPKEIWRVLKPGGLFITQQVGAENDRELVDLLMPEKVEIPFSEQYLRIAKDKFQQVGFEILRGEECFRPIRFFDVGALVWFARIIEWEFPDFSVERCEKELLRAQEVLEKQGKIEGRTHRFLLVAKK